LAIFERITLPHLAVVVIINLFRYRHVQESPPADDRVMAWAQPQGPDGKICVVRLDTSDGLQVVLA
jgi:hypothetical protein